MENQTLPRGLGPPSAAGSSTRPRRWFFLAFKVLVSGALLYYLLRGTSLQEIVETLSSARLSLFSAALGLYLLRLLIGAYRWKLLLQPLGVKARSGFLFRSNLVAAFFSNLLPTIIGGDPVRIYDSWRMGAGKSGAVSVILLDRLIGLVALILFAVVGMAASRRLVESLELPLLEVWIGGGMLAMLALLWIVFHPESPTLGRLSRLSVFRRAGLEGIVDDSLVPFSGRTDTLLKSLGLSLLLQLAVIFHYAVLAAALNLPVPMSAFFVIAPLAILVMMLPISINAIGLRENAFVFFFGLYGVRVSQSIAFAWLALAILLIVGVAGGVVLAGRKEGRAWRTRPSIPTDVLDEPAIGEPEPFGAKSRR